MSEVIGKMIASKNYLKLSLSKNPYSWWEYFWCLPKSTFLQRIKGSSKGGRPSMPTSHRAVDIFLCPSPEAQKRKTSWHCCLAPCKFVLNYGPLTEPKIYKVKFGRTAISTLNGRISETKRDFLDPLVPKFSYDRGLSPTLSWKWPSATLSSSFDLFQSEKNTFSECSRCASLVKICPRDPSGCRRCLWSLSLMYFH